MRLPSCFCQAPGLPLDHVDEAPRKRTVKRSSTSQSSGSRSSIQSNSSISRLPPCKRVSDPKIEAMMMPLPEELRPSRCLRLSQPKTYSNIVDAMKASRGCRDWRNFAVFHGDEVDLRISATDVAAKRAADYERRLRSLSAFSDDPDAFDMIG